MATREISRESWIDFFDDFSKKHEGWLVSIEVLGDLGAQTQAEDMPLEGISADRGEHDIAITMMGPDDRLVEHFIDKPRLVRIEEDDEEGAIQIESNRGDTTLVSFHSGTEPAPGEARLT